MEEILKAMWVMNELGGWSLDAAHALMVVLSVMTELPLPFPPLGRGGKGKREGPVTYCCMYYDRDKIPRSKADGPSWIFATNTANVRCW